MPGIWYQICLIEKLILRENESAKSRRQISWATQIGQRGTFFFIFQNAALLFSRAQTGEGGKLKLSKTNAGKPLVIFSIRAEIPTVRFVVHVGLFRNVCGVWGTPIRVLPWLGMQRKILQKFRRFSYHIGWLLTSEVPSVRCILASKELGLS